jgi:tetratricopeptide (TPR) repeat protein
VAKLLEQSWLGRPQGTLTPEEAYLLDRAAQESRLIPLRRFHPSVAYLSSQEDAALAYAQVLSFLHYLEDRLPEKWLPQLLAELGDGQELDDVFADLSKFTLERLYLWWSQAVSGKRQTPVPAVRRMQRLFKRGQAAEQVRAESLLGDDVRKHLRVGDLLRLRGHLKAAIVEFREAQRLAAYRAPAIGDRLAACLLELGDAEAVVELLPPLAELYPAYSTIFIQLGQALAALDRGDEALAALERANGINPFHPVVHCKLSDLYSRAGQDKLAMREAEHCRLLASYPQSDPGQEVFPLE